MPKPITDLRLLVFGATGAIGGAVCRELYGAGARLHLTARRAGPLAMLAPTLGATASVSDVNDSDAVHEAILIASGTLGGLDGVILCVGPLALAQTPRAVSGADRPEASVHLDAAMAVVRAAARRMCDTGGGQVVLCVPPSRRGRTGGQPVTEGANARVRWLVRTATTAYGAEGLRVNAVSVGASPQVPSAGSPSTVAPGVPTQCGGVDDVAHAVRFLLESSWTTGQVLDVSGHRHPTADLVSPTPG